jgi:tRNA dimethylallyltransferase
MDKFKQIAIIGPTASGKTSLAIDIALHTNSVILSLDSLSVYKQIDTSSAKPTLKERAGVKHFGIDEVYPQEEFDVMEFIKCYKKAREYAIKNLRNLIIVGGSGFYLKAMIDGISPNITTSKETKIWVSKQLEDLEKSYKILQKLDPTYCEKIKSNDRYRIEKALEIYKQTNLAPSEFFKQNPKQKIIENIDIFEIIWDVEKLRERIRQRTKIMLDNGLIDEVIFLEKKYTREPKCMGSIGIVETLEYLDSKISKKELEEKIFTNTARLAKKQRTFNRHQFKNQTKNSLNELKKDILKKF